MHQHRKIADGTGRSVEQSRSTDSSDDYIAKTSNPGGGSRDYRDEYNLGYSEGEADYPGYSRRNRYVATSYAYDQGYDAGREEAKKKSQSFLDALGTGVSPLFRGSIPSTPSASTTRATSQQVLPVTSSLASQPVTHVMTLQEPPAASASAAKESEDGMSPALVMGLAIGGGVLVGSVVLLAYRSMRRR